MRHPVIANAIVAAIHARLAPALAPPPGRYRPLVAGALPVGWLDDERASRLAAHPEVFVVTADAIRFAPQLDTADARSAAVERVAQALADAGQLSPWRGERYAVGAGFGAPPLFLLERAAARYFGIHTYAAHVNGLVYGDGGTAMWIARRSPQKAIDPDMLDNLVGGGIAAGSGVAQTVVKESQEEAGITAALAAQARPVGALHICREAPDGIQRETIFAYDLDLPPDWTPTAMDGEVVEHRLVTLQAAAALAANTEGRDRVTVDASLVIADCLIRHGCVAADAPAYVALEALRHPALHVGPVPA